MILDMNTLRSLKQHVIGQIIISKYPISKNKDQVPQMELIQAKDRLREHLRNKFTNSFTGGLSRQLYDERTFKNLYNAQDSRTIKGLESIKNYLVVYSKYQTSDKTKSTCQDIPSLIALVEDYINKFSKDISLQTEHQPMNVTQNQLIVYLTSSICAFAAIVGFGVNTITSEMKHFQPVPQTASNIAELELLETRLSQLNLMIVSKSKHRIQPNSKNSVIPRLYKLHPKEGVIIDTNLLENLESAFSISNGVTRLIVDVKIVKQVKNQDSNQNLNPSANNDEIIVEIRD
jgi:hypothetical protein